MSCTAEQIAEKRREAAERLKQTKANAQASKPNASSNNATSPGTAAKSFYGKQQNEKADALDQYQNKLKQDTKHNTSNRILSQPYPKRDGNTNAPQNASANTNTNWKATFGKVVTCTCSMISATRFQVIISGYSEKLIDTFKSIPTRAYSEYCLV